MSVRTSMLAKAAIEAARRLNSPEAASKVASMNHDTLELITPVLPAYFDQEGRPRPEAVINAEVSRYYDQQKKAMLSHSIAMALQTRIESSHAYPVTLVEDQLKKLGTSVVRRAKENVYEVTVTIPGGVYVLKDTDRHCAALRGLHFALTRHDPDTDEYIKLSLAKEVEAANAKAKAMADAKLTEADVEVRTQQMGTTEAASVNPDLGKSRDNAQETE